MSGRRRAFVHSLVAVVVGGSFGVALLEGLLHPAFRYEGAPAEVVFEDDYFSPRAIPLYPFASYPMFSDRFDPARFHHIELRVVHRGKERPFSVLRHVPPLWRRGLLEVVQNQWIAGRPPEDIFRPLLRRYLDWKSHRPDGFGPGPEPVELPPAESLKVYLASWDWDTWLAFRRSSPDLRWHQDWRDTGFAPARHRLLVEVEP